MSLAQGYEMDWVDYHAQIMVNEFGKPEHFDSFKKRHPNFAEDIRNDFKLKQWRRNMDEQRPLFTYGDKVRRKSGGPVVTVQRIDDQAYHFAEGGFSLIADQDCYRLVEKASGYFLVASDLRNAPTDDYLQHGYEDRQDFIDALRKLLGRWRGRTGQNVGERNGFLRLCFRDIPGGGHEEAWLPLYLLTPTAAPGYAICHEPTPEELIERELDQAFGFD